MSVVDNVVDGQHWRISTSRGPVHVWRPAHYRGDRCILYVHGYNTAVDQAWSAHGLPQQFKASGVEAVYVVPEAPVSSGDSVRWTDLEALVAEVVRQTGMALRAPYHVLGHSGAYRTIARWLDTPGLQKITLLDALYGNVTDFARWAAVPGHVLVTIAIGGKPLENSRAIAKKPGVTFVQVSSSHMGLVTSGAFIPTYLRALGGAGQGVVLAVLAAVGTAVYLLMR